MAFVKLTLLSFVGQFWQSIPLFWPHTRHWPWTVESITAFRNYGEPITMNPNRALPAAAELREVWQNSPRWRGIDRPYQAEDVVRLRGTWPLEHSIARLTAEKLWRYLNEKPFVSALGALTGNQALQQVRAGLDAIYLSGWQVAGDANLAGQMYPDQSLYPADSVPNVVRRINNTLRRADEIHPAEGDDRGGRGRRAFRGSALFGQEVRSHGWQGAGADPGGDLQAGGSAPRGRCLQRTDAAGRAHRC